MTYSEFRSLVLGFLERDATRAGISDLRNSLLRGAIADLKHFVPELRDGKAAYADTDIVLFNDKCAEAVAAYIKSRIVRMTEKDLALSQSYWQDYLTIRRQLYRDFRSESNVIKSDWPETAILNFQVTKEGVIINAETGDPVGGTPSGDPAPDFTFRVFVCQGDETPTIAANLPAAVDDLATIEITDAANGQVRVTIPKSSVEDRLAADENYYFEFAMLSGPTEIPGAGPGDPPTPVERKSDILVRGFVRWGSGRLIAR